MHKITLKDFPELNLGDKRRNERFVTIINNVASQPGSSIPKQSGDWYGTKATYEFFRNKDVTLTSLQAAISCYGGSLLAHASRVLIAHDFCQVSYKDLQAEGLGYLANKEGKGIILYNSIAISDEGIPLSLLYQQSFVRPFESLGKAKQRRSTPFKDKESYYWHKGITEVNSLLGTGTGKIHIADREADIYDLFFSAYEENTDLLIRATHNRKLGDGSHLWDLVNIQEPSKIILQIPDKTGRKREGVEVEVRYHEVEILRPRDNKQGYESVVMTGISLCQVSPLHKWQQEPLHWQLLTTLEVSNLADALQCVKWYCMRWLIERFHYVLKSGTRIEELQLKHADSLQKAIHVYSIAAMRIMQLVYLSRQKPGVSCDVILTQPQWAVLYLLIHKTAVLPKEPPSLEEAVCWIGRLGGHLARKSDGPPGVKTVWRGYQRICDAADVYELLALQNLGKG